MSEINTAKEYLLVDCRFRPDGRPPEPLMIWPPNGRAYPVLGLGGIRILHWHDHGHTGYQIAVRIKLGMLDLYFADRECRWYATRQDLEKVMKRK